MSDLASQLDEPGQVHFWTIYCYRRMVFFWHDPMKRVVVSALRTLQKQFGICLIGYVVMPEHVHVLLYPHARGSKEPIPIATLLKVFRKYVELHGKNRLRDFRDRYGQLWSDSLSAWAMGRLGTDAIWEKRGLDFIVTRPDTLIEKLQYCHKNPVIRGLVKSPEEWKWSSFRYYERGEASGLAMDWDGQWPIVW
jgi:putative transposase